MKSPPRVLLIAGILAVTAISPAVQSKEKAAPGPVATFSIVAFDPASGDLGVAVQSKFFGVGSVVPWAKAGVGAVATQSYANVSYGPDGLKRLQKGEKATEVLAALIDADPEKTKRQAAIIDAQGEVAVHTGSGCHDWAGHRTGDFFSVQGNLLASEEVVKAMAEAYEKDQKSGKGELADWLMTALEAGQLAGGDKRGRQSAAILVVRKNGGYAGGNDRFVDLRVEDHPTPIKELTRLVKKHKTFFPRAISK